MKVFISWSGKRSKAIADLLDNWIKCVIQAVDPWMSSKDIDRGSMWFTEITDQLMDTNVGIVCLTQDNKNSPWILFESGALAKGLSSNRVCTLLIDLSPADISNPLAQFNHTTLDKEGIYGLVRTINLSLQEKGLRNEVLDNVFETYWPNLESDIKQALAANPLEENAKSEPRPEHEILEEMLGTIRSLDKRMRNIEDATNSSYSPSSSISLKSLAEANNIMDPGSDAFSLVAALSDFEKNRKLSNSAKNELLHKHYTVNTKRHNPTNDSTD